MNVKQKEQIPSGGLKQSPLIWQLFSNPSYLWLPVWIRQRHGLSVLEGPHRFGILYICELRHLCARRDKASNFLSWISWSPHRGCLNVVHGSLSVGLAVMCIFLTLEGWGKRGDFGARWGYIGEQNKTNKNQQPTKSPKQQQKVTTKTGWISF